MKLTICGTFSNIEVSDDFLKMIDEDSFENEKDYRKMKKELMQAIKKALHGVATLESFDCILDEDENLILEE